MVGSNYGRVYRLPLITAVGCCICNNNVYGSDLMYQFGSKLHGSKEKFPKIERGCKSTSKR